MKLINRDPSTCNTITQQLLSDLFKCGNPILNKVSVHSNRFYKTCLDLQRYFIWHVCKVCNFVSGVGPTKACATAQFHQFLSYNLQKFTHWTEAAWQLTELLNLYICHNQKFIQDDLDERMSIWTDVQTTKCFSNTCWLLLLLMWKWQWEWQTFS